MGRSAIDDEKNHVAGSGEKAFEKRVEHRCGDAANT
jgi:hypothetical protein